MLEKRYEEVLKGYNIEEKESLLKYLMGKKLSLDEIGLLEKIYLKNIESQKKELASKLDIIAIKSLISCVSFSYNNCNEKYNENIFERNLRIFPNINSFLLLYTKETEKIYEEIKSKYKEINIIGILVTDYSFFSIQDKVKDILKELRLNRNNCIIDITLGLKIFTISLYKIAIENGIVALNWQEIQSLDFNKKIKNISFKSKLKIMIEPKRENIKIYSKINELLEKYKYEEIEFFYAQLNNEEMQFFYNNLAKLFSFDLMIGLDYELFYKKMELFFINLSMRKNYTREFILKTRKFLSNLLSLIIFEEDEEGVKIIEHEWLKRFISNFQISLVKLEDNSFFLAKYKQEIYYYYILNYFYSKVESNDYNYYYRKFINNIKQNILKELGIKDKALKERFLKNQSGIEEFISLEISDKLYELNPAMILKENLNSSFYLKNNVLYIEKYNLEIDINKDLRMKFLTYKGADLLRELLENHKKKQEKKELFEKLALYKEEESEKNRKNRFRRNLVNVKKKIEKLNKIIKEIGKELGLELDDIIIYKKENLLNNKDSDYCHSFSVNSKYYILI